MKFKVTQVLLRILNVVLFPVTIVIFAAPIFVIFLPFFSYDILVLALRFVLLFWLIVFITSTTLLTTYCGYLCPITKLFNLVAQIFKDNNILSHRFPKVVGDITLFLWNLGMIYVLLRLTGNIFGFLPREEIYSSVEVVLFYILYGFASVLLKTEVGSDELGHYLCPLTTYIKLGIWINKKLNLRGFRIIVNPQSCKHCKLCNKVCSYQNDVERMVMDGIINYKVCSNCGRCIKVCKQNSIQRSWSRLKNTHM